MKNNEMWKVRDERFEYVEEGEDIIVPIYTPEYWGKDHAETLLYIEAKCINHYRIKSVNLCGNEVRHPWAAQYKRRLNNPDSKWRGVYATKIKGRERPSPHHDDWYCIEDMKRAGLLTFTGPPNWIASLTPLGIEVALDLRRHKHLDRPLDEFDFVQSIKQAVRVKNI